MTAYAVFTSAPPWGVLSEKHIYQLVVYEHGRPDRPDQQIANRVGLTDDLWSLINECWNKEAGLRPTLDTVVQLWAAQLHPPSSFIDTLSQPTHQPPKITDDASSIHSYSSGPPAYESEFPHLMPPPQFAFPSQPSHPSQPAPIITTSYTSLLPPSVASYVGSSYSPPLLPGMEPIRPLQIRNRRDDSASPQRSLSTTEFKPQQFGRTEEQSASTSTFAMSTSLPAPSALPPMPPGWVDQTPFQPQSGPPSRDETSRSWSRPPSRNEIERPSSRASNRSTSRAGSERGRSESPFRSHQVVSHASSKHLSTSSSLRSVSSYSLRPTITTSARADEFDNRPLRANTYSSPLKQPPSIPSALPEEQTPEEGPRSPLQLRFASPEPLPPGAAYVPSPPQQTQANSQISSESDTTVGYGLSAPTTPAWDVRSFSSDGISTQRGTLSVTASTNAVALVSALQTAINNSGALSSPLEFGSRREEEEEEDEEAGEAEIDFVLLKIHALACQSEKDAQRLVTAGIIPTLLGLMTTRFRTWKTAKKTGPQVSSISSRHGLEMVLITLGATAYVWLCLL